MENPFEELRALLMSGRPEEAERKLLAVAPRARAPRLMLARLANEQGHWWLAEKLARELISWDARDSEAWSAQAFAAFSQGRHRQARAAYEQALSIAPNYDAARRNLAAVLAEQELSEEALAHAEELSRRGPATPSLERTRARALVQLDRFEEAEQILLRLIGVQPLDTASHELLVRLRQLRGDADPARALRASAEQTGDVRLRMSWANALRRLSDAPGAERELRALLATLGPLPQLVGSLATVIQDQGRMADAFAFARDALSGAPADVDIAETFVATAIASGQAAESLPVIERMRAERPRDQRWVTHRIDAARALGQPEFESWWDPARVTRHYDLPVESLEALRDEVLALHREGNHPLDQSLREGTQTSRNLLVRPGKQVARLLSLFKDAVERFRAEVIASLPPSSAAGAHPLVRDASPAELVGCWSVKLRRGGFHVNHIHPEGWVSSAFYLVVPAEVHDRDRRAGWLKFGEPRYLVTGLDPTGFVQPAPGRLVLFPSYLWHGTNALSEAEPRVSVAFDALPAAEIR